MTKKEIFESIFNFLKESISGKVMLALIIIVMTCCFTKCDYYREHFQIPICSFEHTEGQDVVKSDIKLADMSIIATPLIVIKRENEVVYAVKVENYYNKNYTSCDDTNENTSHCTINVTDEQQLKMVSLSKKIRELLEKKQEFVNCDVYIAYLVNITWQNEKSNTVRNGYWYFTDGIERHIAKEELEKWGEKLKSEIDLDNYEEKGFIYNNEQLMQIIDSCASMIFNKNKEYIR